MTKFVFIPHLKKMAVSDLLPIDWDDLSDPPLATESMAKAETLTEELIQKFGSPLGIFQSTKLRCRQTAGPMVQKFVNPFASRKDTVPLVTLDTLAQTENGDLDPDNPAADEKKLVYYGPRSNSLDWYRWYEDSMMVITELTEMWRRHSPFCEAGRHDNAVYVFTHRPIVAAARHTAQGKQDPTGPDDIDALDKTLLPYCVFAIEPVRGQQWLGYGPKRWVELPRD